jgi:phosphatidate phosphatase PAH1
VQVSVTVNSEPVDLKMMLGPLGEAFFISEIADVCLCAVLMRAETCRMRRPLVTK